MKYEQEDANGDKKGCHGVAALRFIQDLFRFVSPKTNIICFLKSVPAASPSP